MRFLGAAGSEGPKAIRPSLPAKRSNAESAIGVSRRGWDGACQCLVEMVVGVDQTRQNQITCQVEHLIGLVGQTTSLPYVLYEAITNKKTTVGNLPLVVIHRKDMCVCDEKGCHEF